MDTPTAGPSLHDLAQRLDALERHNERLSLENRELREGMRTLQSNSFSLPIPATPDLGARSKRAIVQAPVSPEGGVSPVAALEQLSRRWVLRRGMQATAATVAAGVLLRHDSQGAAANHAGGGDFDYVTAHQLRGESIEGLPGGVFSTTSSTWSAIVSTNEGTAPAVKGTSAGGPAILGESLGTSSGSTGVSGSGASQGVYGFSENGVGVLGDGSIGVQGVTSTNGNAAVYGQHTTNCPGVVGDGVGSGNAGVLGRNSSTSGIGVRGEGANGVVGASTAPGYGAVYGQHTNNGYGVVGDGVGSSNAGVLGRNPTGVGVRGEGSRGVHGISAAYGNAAIFGQHTGADEGAGIFGEAAGSSGVGVLGIGKHGVRGTSSVAGGNAVLGDGIGAATGVKGTSASGYGAVLGGGRAQVRLVPRGTTGKPMSGYHQIGELYLDKGGVLFICTGGGTPGTWRKVSTTLA